MILSCLCQGHEWKLVYSFDNPVSVVPNRNQQAKNCGKCISNRKLRTCKGTRMVLSSSMRAPQNQRGQTDRDRADRNRDESVPELAKSQIDQIACKPQSDKARQKGGYKPDRFPGVIRNHGS